jgi:aerobic-type carbon monoxide dehydrogenase small subunit (CoxS/CutS family)
VNGRDYEVPVDASDESIPLLWVLRNDLGLTGTKFGCGTYTRIFAVVKTAASGKERRRRR